MQKLAIRLLGPEFARRSAIEFLRRVPLFTSRRKRLMAQSASLQQRLFGLNFSNPLGTAAGLDKDALIYKNLFRLGFAWVEVGTVLCQPHAGNAGKRLYRLKQDDGIINRLGFPSEGMHKVSQRLGNNRQHVLGVNIASHPESSDIFADYRILAAQFANCADYLTINISCPNIDNSKDLQTTEFLPRILQATQAGLLDAEQSLPLLLKLSPDLSYVQLRQVVDIAMQYHVAGLIMGNTTRTRPPDLRASNKHQQGGLSGKPLFALSTAKLGQLYLICQRELPLIGVGGIDSAETAYSKIKAGADLLQIYSGLVYRGVGLPHKIITSLSQLLKEDGYEHISEAVGCEAQLYGDKPDMFGASVTNV